MTAKEALYNISYRNAIMYSRAMPMPDDEKEDANKPLYDESLDACNSHNYNKFTDFEDEEVVKA